MRDTARHLRDGVRDGVRDMSELRDRVGENSARSRIATARRSFNARLPRVGRVRRQCERCLTIHNPASMSQLRSWCYAGEPFQRWQCWSIKRALRKLGARQIGRAGGIGRPGIWSLDRQTTAL
jgi:hypothetical protein